MPLIDPSTVDRAKPFGSFPLDDQMQKAVHPLAVSVCEYAEFTVQFGSVVGLIVIAA